MTEKAAFSGAPSALDYFKMLIGADDDLPVFEAVTSLDLDRDPGSDLLAPQHEIDRLAQQFLHRLPADCSQIQRLQRLNHYFFRELGFAGNVNHYYDPANSYIQHVMATRRGIPITLAVIYIELARQVGLDMQGISFPGHFLMKLRVPAGDVVIDPFNGASLTREELEERLLNYLDEAEELTFATLAHCLKTASPRDILTRVLRNLKNLYGEREEWTKLLNVQLRLRTLLPDDISERRDLGITRARLDQREVAIADLEAYLEQRPQAPDAAEVTAWLIRLRDAHRRHT